MRSHRDLEPSTDSRLAATTRIWSFATAMLAISVILSPLRDRIAVPIAIVSSAAVGTACVWKPQGKAHNTKEEERLEEIEQRLHTLETIAAAEDLEMWLKTRHMASRN